MASGKTHVARHLAQKGFTQVALASPIKYVCELLLTKDNGINLSSEFLYDLGMEELCGLVDDEVMDLLRRTEKISYTPPKSRKRLQYFGTEFRNEILDTFWTKVLLRSLSPEIPYVLDDCRFTNEFSMLKNGGFTFIKLNVSPEMQEKRLLHLYGKFDPSILTHASELDIDSLAVPDDMIIDADLPLDMMLKEVDKLVHSM